MLDASATPKRSAFGSIEPWLPVVVVSITTFSEQALGDFSTLPERLHAEAAASNSVIACFALFGACAHVGLAGFGIGRRHRSEIWLSAERGIFLVLHRNEA